MWAPQVCPQDRSVKHELYSQYPGGTRDRLFGECMERRSVQKDLTRLFRRRGYTEIMTPEMEYYDVFTLAGNNIPQENLTKVIDRSGKICVMRPDMTTPIARVAGTKLKDMVLPRRFYYNGNVYRSSSGHKGENSEIPQCGVELIGAGGIKADLEVIAAAVDAMKACGLEKFHVELGHAGIFRLFADRLEMDAEEEEKMRCLIEGKNYAALNDFLQPYENQEGCGAIKRLIFLFGGVEVLDEADALQGGASEVTSYLRNLYETLCTAGFGEHVKFDLGMVHQLDYYTGVIFRGYAEGAGVAVLSGGRYDNLATYFGRPGTGPPALRWMWTLWPPVCPKRSCPRWRP